MVPPRRPPAENMNGTGKRNSTNMSFQRKDVADGRVGASRGDGRPQNGARAGFRTDTAISNNRPGTERVLQRWVPDAPSELDGSLEKTASSAPWDQFAENERLFGLKTDYNENFYTTAIDKSHPQYSERMAAADRKAREIETTTATTAHVAEERVMDFAGANNQGEDEEDKYSGVRRQQDFPPLSAASRDNKYTPPARRAPAGHSTVTGAPVDPAIISSQIKGGPGQGSKKPLAAKTDDLKAPTANTNRSSPASGVKTPEPKVDPKTDIKTNVKADAKTGTAKQGDAKASTAVPAPAESAKLATDSKPSSVAATSTSANLRVAVTPQRTSLTPGSKATTSTTSSSAVNSPAPPSATENVEKSLLKDFKDFASQQRLNAEKARHNKMKADAQVKLQELKKFATSFKLSTPVPTDLISIIAKDPAKQKQIQEKALQNAEEVAKSKTETKTKGSESPATSVTAKTPSAATPPGTAATAGTSSGPASGATFVGPSGAASDKPAARPQGPAHNTHNAHNAPGPGVNNNNNRHPSARGPYIQQGYRQQSQPYRDRSGGQHVPQGHNTGNLAERIRSSDQNRYSKAPPPHGQSHFNATGDMRPPPTGPANAVDPNYSRRLSAIPPSAHMAPKLNPTTHEFRPSPFAASFNPTGPSAGSSPRSAINSVLPDSSLAGTATSTASTVAAAPSPRVVAGVLIRRKTKAVDSRKCHILTFVRTIKPPQGRNWDENDGLRPSYDTAPTWRQIQDEEKEDSTMRLTYKQYFERMVFSAASMATPIQSHAMPHGVPQMAHQHQLPLHLQHGGHMGPRPNQHMPPMPMHGGGGGPHGHVPHVSFNGSDDHRMMPSNSAQSYASPRLAQVPMYPQQVGSTPQMQYNQPAMPPFMPSTPQMNNYRNYPGTPQQYMSPQAGGPMMPMMPPQQFVVPGGMMAGGQQMPVYPGAHQFIAPPGAPGAGGVPPPQSMAGSNGYPSPGRPVAAPMMVQQGSQQGQPMYGMSPSMQYQQPAYGPQHPGQGAKGPMRGGYNNPGSQQFGTSPQHVHQYGPPHRNGSGGYNGKNYQNHNHNSHHGPPHHGGQPPAAVSGGHQGRAGGDGSDEAK